MRTHFSCNSIIYCAAAAQRCNDVHFGVILAHVAAQQACTVCNIREALYRALYTISAAYHVRLSNTVLCQLLWRSALAAIMLHALRVAGESEPGSQGREFTSSQALGCARSVAATAGLRVSLRPLTRTCIFAISRAWSLQKLTAVRLTRFLRTSPAFPASRLRRTCQKEVRPAVAKNQTQLLPTFRWVRFDGPAEETALHHHQRSR